MLYAAIAIIFVIVIYATRKIDEFTDTIHDPSACNQNCRQGRDCDCGERV